MREYQHAEQVPRAHAAGPPERARRPFAPAGPGPGAPIDTLMLLELQSRAGNAAVQRLLAPATEAPAVVVQRAGKRKRKAAAGGPASKKASKKASKSSSAKPVRTDDDDGYESGAESARDEDTPAAEEPAPGRFHKDMSLIAAVADALESKHGWRVDGKGSQSARMHKTANTAALGTGTVKGLRKAVYTGQMVTSRRNYRENGLENRQVLRWIATLTAQYLQASAKLKKEEFVEVQTTVHEDHLWVATNIAKTNRFLEADVGSATAAAFIEKMVRRAKAPPRAADRTGRHISKLAGSADHVGGWLTAPDRAPAVAAARTNPLKVSTAIPKDQHGAEIKDAHAERRLAESLNVDHLDATLVGGLRRPCVFCYLHLFHGQQHVRPGPLWISEAATMLDFNRLNALGIPALLDADNPDAEALARLIDTAVVQTNASDNAAMKRPAGAAGPEGAPDWDNDTGSASD